MLLNKSYFLGCLTKYFYSETLINATAQNANAYISISLYIYRYIYSFLLLQVYAHTVKWVNDRCGDL